MTLAAFGIPLNVVFAGPGARLLDRRAGRDTELLAMLPGMGIETVQVEVPEDSRPPLASEDSVLPFEVVTPERVKALLAAARHTVNL